MQMKDSLVPTEKAINRFSKFLMYPQRNPVFSYFQIVAPSSHKCHSPLQARCFLVLTPLASRTNMELLQEEKALECPDLSKSMTTFKFNMEKEENQVKITS